MDLVDQRLEMQLCEKRINDGKANKEDKEAAHKDAKKDMTAKKKELEIKKNKIHSQGRF